MVLEIVVFKRAFQKRVSHIKPSSGRTDWEAERYLQEYKHMGELLLLAAGSFFGIVAAFISTLLVAGAVFALWSAGAFAKINNQSVAGFLPYVIAVLFLITLFVMLVIPAFLRRYFVWCSRCLAIEPAFIAEFLSVVAKFDEQQVKSTMSIGRPDFYHLELIMKSINNVVNRNKRCFEA